MSSIDTLFTQAKFADGLLKDIAVFDGRIVAISAAGSGNPTNAPAIDLGGALVDQSLVQFVLLVSILPEQAIDAVCCSTSPPNQVV